VTSALYLGSVVHVRFKPQRHRLRYRLFWMLVDLDELPSLSRRLRLFSRDRFNLFSFRERDHLAGTAAPLRTQVERELAAAGIDLEGGPIRLLCMPRVLGTVFNPISVFLCHRRDGTLAALFYEVNNTFGQRHSYLIPVADPSARVIRQSCDKQFYVSPFMRMAMTYDFRVVPPAGTTTVIVNGRDADGPLISAAFTGRRASLTDRALLGVLLRFGLLAFQVLGAIHWEALKLWLKGLRLQPRPAPPAHPVTSVPLTKG
jgi:hypothetical protein